MNVTVLPAEDPADVRERDLCPPEKYRTGDCFYRRGSFNGPAKRRPSAFRELDGRPTEPDID